MPATETWQPPEVAGTEATPASTWSPPTGDKASAGFAPVIKPVSFIARTDPDAHWRKVYSEEYSPDQHRALSSIDSISKNPEEDRKRAVNQAFVADKLGMPSASVASNWDAVKAQFAKSEMNIDDPKISDKSLHGFIQSRLTPAPLRLAGSDEGQGEVKPWTWQDTLRNDVYQTKKSVGAFFDSFSHSPIDRIPDPPKDLPDFSFPGQIMSPAVAAGIWTGAVKPLLSFATSPIGVATAGAGEGLGAIAKAGGPAATYAKTTLAGMSGLFAAWMGYGTFQALPETRRILNDPNASTQDKVAAVSGTISSAIFTTLGAMGAVHAAMPSKAPAIAEALKGKTPSEAAEVLSTEAMTAPPEAADALKRAATHFEELSGYERGPEEWAVAAHPQERIVAAAIKSPDGTVAEGTAHEEIKAELRSEATVSEKTDPIPGAQEGFVTSSGRFVDRQEAAQISEATGQSQLEKPEGHALQSHEVDFGPRSTMGQTSLKNAYGELERVAYGFDEATPTEQRGMAERWARSADVLAKDPEAGARLAAQLKANPNLGLSDDQSAILLRHKVGLENALNEAADAAADPNSSAKLKGEAQKQVKELSNQLLELLDAVNKRGSEWGREGRWRQALAREDYSFASQETLLRASKGGAELSPDETDALRKRISVLEQRQAELEAHVARTASVGHAEAADEAVREMTKPPRAPRQFRTAEKVRSALHNKAEESRKFLSGKLFTISPEVVYHMSVIGADKLYSTGLDFAKWSTAMISDLGEKARPALAEAWAASKKLFHAENRAGLIAELTAKAPGERIKALSGIAQELARAKIEQGVTDRAAIVDAVHGDVAKAMPDVSKRAVMDAISGYGQFRKLTHDQVTDRLRDIKGQLQQVAKLEDMAAGEAPKKTGMERKSPSDEERRLIQQVEEEKKKGGYNVTDPAKQLRTALDTVKTRLANQISDLEKQIATREKIVKVRRPAPRDDEVDLLRERRDELKEEFDGIFGRPTLTPEQRLNIWKAYANRRIGELNERLETGDLAPKPKSSPVALDSEGAKLKGELERAKQDFAIARAVEEEKKKPKWQKALREVSGLARASALSGYHTLVKLASFSLGRFAETPVTEALGAMMRQIPGIKGIAERANLEAGREYQAVARYYSQAATNGMTDAWETLRTGKSALKAELGDRKYNVTPIRWYDYFGLSHMVEKSPLLRGEFELRLEKGFQSAIANGLDVNDPMVAGAIRKDAFAYAQRAILQEDNMFSDWINSLTQRLEAKNPNLDKADVTKVAISTFVKTFLTKGIVKTPSNYIMQTLERTPLGVAKGTLQAVVAHAQGVEKLTPEEANTILRLIGKAGLVGTGVFVYGMIDATKKPQDRVFGGYYQPGDKRSDEDVGWGKIRVAGHEFPHLVTHNPLTESGQMGSTFMRVMMSKLHKKDAQDRGALAGAVAAVMGIAAEAPIVNPITKDAEAVSRGEANKIVWDLAAGLVPQLVQNIAQDLDKGKARKPESFKEAIELTLPGLRSNVPETKAQKKKDMKEKLSPYK